MTVLVPLFNLTAVERHDTEGVPIRLLKREKEMSDEDWKALLERVNRGDFPDWL